MNKIDKILAQTKDIQYRTVDTDKAWSKFKANVSVEQVVEEPSKIRPLKSRQWLSIAATFLVLLTATFVFWPESPTFETQIALDESSTIQMVDGSVINLGKNSEVTFPIVLKDLDERLILLKGNATFDVAHNPDKPFIVKKGDLLVEVLGTEFTLTGEENGDITVENHEGRVKASDVKDPSISIILNKGDKMRFTPKGFVDLNYVEPVIIEPIIDHTATYSLYQVYFNLYERSNGGIDLDTNAVIDGRSNIRLDLTQDLQTILKDISKKANLEYTYDNNKDMILISELTEK